MRHFSGFPIALIFKYPAAEFLHAGGLECNALCSAFDFLTIPSLFAARLTCPRLAKITGNNDSIIMWWSLSLSAALLLPLLSTVEAQVGLTRFRR